jgi:outer membrane autotransporter protein
MQDCGSFVHRRIAGDEPRCAWARFDYDSSSRDAQDGFPSTEEIARRFSLGYQQALEGGWTVGIGVDFEHNDSSGFDDRWQGDTSNVQFGFLGRRAFGATSVGAVLMLGNSGQNVDRLLSVTDGAVANGVRDVPSFTGVLDVTHRIDMKGLGVTPALNIGLSSMYGDSMQETGAGAQNVVLDSRSETHSWVEPTLAFDHESSLANRKVLRVYARLGVLYYLTGATTEVRAGLEGAPDGVQLMLISSDLDSTHFSAEAGFELIATDRYTLSLSYARQSSDIRESDTGTARITVPVH